MQHDGPLIVGVDLGTTYTVCSYFDAAAGTSKILPIEQPWNGWRKDNFRRNNQLDSTVFLYCPEGSAETHAFVGRYCNEFRKYPSQEHIYRLFKSIKRQMGTGWRTEFNATIWTPSRIAGIILKAVANAILAAFERLPDHLVITVPAAFSTEQRRETVAAAKLAGFDPSAISLIDEPTAALLHYIAENPHEFVSQEQKYIAMLDIGGGTFDVSIIEVSVSGGALFVDTLASSRYNEVAGDDFDLNVAALMLEKMPDGQVYFEQLSPQEQRSIAWRLVAEAERVKKEISLSAALKSKIDLKRVPPESPYRLDDLPKKRRMADTITFQELTGVLEPFFYLDRRDAQANLYYPTIYKPIFEAFAAASGVLRVPGFGEDAIDKVFCTGGSSYLYHFQAALGKFFGQNPIIIDPDYAVSKGAALYRPLINNTLTVGSGRLSVVFRRRMFDGIYLKSEGGDLLEIIPPNIPIPSRREAMDVGLVMPRRDYRLMIEVYSGRGKQDTLMTSYPRREIYFDDLIPAGVSIFSGYEISSDNQVHLSFTAGEYEGRLQVIDDYNLALDNFRLPQVNKVSE